MLRNNHGNALLIAILLVGVSACSMPKSDAGTNLAPSSKYDMSHWKITLPVDENGDGKADSVSVRKMDGFIHEDYFYLDDDGYMVFASPNKAASTPNSTNTRSELRYMLRGGKTRIKTSSPLNHFALKSHPAANKHAAIGGRMEATLKVDHVSVNAGYPDKEPAYSVVIGQIHGKKAKILNQFGYGWGNEPLKIFYKKWPGHETGSVFWNYERNLPKDDPNRTDIAYAVWGNSWDDKADPGASGIALGEEFSYTVNVFGDVMYLTFESQRLGTVRHHINLADNIDAKGKVDVFDHKGGYTGDMMYFKAGAYNQCSSSNAPSFRYPACPGTGDWQVDKANGNYTQVSFSRLLVGDATKPYDN